MNESTAISDAIELIDERRRNDRKIFNMAFFLITFGLVMIGCTIYFELKADDAAEVSEKISQPYIDHGGASKALMEAIDIKINLLRVEIKLRNKTFAYISGALLGFGIGVLLGYKRKMKINLILENLVYEIQRKNT